MALDTFTSPVAPSPDPVSPIVRQLLSPFLAGSPHSVELVP